MKSFFPKDKFRIVEITFMLIGLTPLVAWNFFLAAETYWSYRFRDVHPNHTDSFSSSKTVDKTELQTYFESYLSIASNAPFVFVLIINALWGEKVPHNIRNLVSLILIIIILIFNTALAEVNADEWQDKFFAITMVSIFFMSVFSAFFQGSTGGIAAAFPPRNINAMVTGQAVCGVFSVFVLLVTIATDLSPTKSAFFYFLTADLTLILVLVMYFVMRNTKYYKYHMEKLSISKRRLEPVLTDSSTSTSNRWYFKIWNVFLHIWPHAITIFLVFWVTLAIFPAITVLIVPTKWTGKYFLALSCFTWYNINDLVGRFAAQYFTLPRDRRYILLALTVLRFALVPLMMLCNIHPREYLPVAFEHELYYILFMFLLSFSNGYLVNVAFIHGSSFAPDDLKENAGFLLMAFAGLGLAFGALSSNILVRIL